MYLFYHLVAVESVVRGDDAGVEAVTVQLVALLVVVVAEVVAVDQNRVLAAVVQNGVVVTVVLTT